MNEPLTVTKRRWLGQAGEAGAGHAPSPVLFIERPGGLAEPPRAAGGGSSVIPVPALR